jgi:hypothetical protein
MMTKVTDHCMKCLQWHSPGVGCNEAERGGGPGISQIDWEAESPDFSTERAYSTLRSVLERAYNQAAYGKGKERHANDKPFHEQPMQALSEQLGNEAGLVFQACKKATEGYRMGDTERTIKEYLGAINYLAGAVIFLEKKANNQKPTGVQNG